MSDHTPTPEWDDEPALLEELGRALGHDPSAVPPDDRVAALRAAAERLRPRPGAAPEADAVRRGSCRRTLLTGGVAAGVGGVAGYLGRRAGESEPEPPTAGPTMEKIEFTGDAAEVTTSALVNHTWGTDLLLDLTGLSAGTAYDVVYETTEGDVTAGSLLAVPDVVMKCRFSAATLRPDVTAIEVRPPGSPGVLRAELPEADQGAT